MLVELSEKEVSALMAADFCLITSREVARGGTYVSSAADLENALRIPFQEAHFVLSDLIEKLLNDMGLTIKGLNGNIYQ